MLVILIDKSGSMAGRNIEFVKTAAMKFGKTYFERTPS